MISDALKINRLSVKRFRSARIFLLLLPWVALLGQFFTAQSSSERSASLIAAIASFIIIYDGFRLSRFYRYPLSSLILLGFSLLLLLGPLSFTLVEGKNIAYNLRVPNITFLHSALAGLIAVFAHYIYRGTLQFRQLRSLLHSLLLRLNLFSPLSLTEVVVMGSLGLAATAAQSWFTGNLILIKFLQGFRFFTIIPIVYLFKGSNPLNQIGSDKPNKKFLWLIFVVYLLLLGLISLGKNSRSSFLEPLAIFGIVIILQWLYGLIRVRMISVISALLATLIIVPFFTDFSIAMIMVRSQREDLSATEVLQFTLNQMQNRDEIREYQLALSLNDSSNSLNKWSEDYVSNPILNRFSNAKFVDNSLYDASFLDVDDKEYLTNFQVSRSIAILPTPILNLLPVEKDLKAKVSSQGYGDTLHYLATGRQSVLGGFRVTHFTGMGMGSIGFSYLLLLFCSLIIIYAFVDSHSICNYAHQLECFAPILSIVAVTQVYHWLTLANSTSLTALVAFPLRSFFEPILLFALIRRLLRFKLKLRKPAHLI